MFGLTPALFYGLIAMFVANIVTSAGWYLSAQEVKREEARVVSCQEERRFYELRVRTAGEIAAKKILAERQQAEQITREVAHGYQNRLDALRADYDGLRKRAAANRASSGRVQSFPIAPARVDEIPADAVPLAAECAETTLQLTELQSWITQQKGAEND